MSLASMIKAAAQMKNLRRGNDTQDFLKKNRPGFFERRLFKFHGPSANEDD